MRDARLEMNGARRRMYGMKMLQSFFVIVAFCLAGCFAAGPQQATVPPRIPDRQTMPQPLPATPSVHEGTIYQAGFDDLYQDGRAHEVGDIILVKIVETSSGSKKAETKATRDSKLSGGVASLFGFEKWVQQKNAKFTPSNTSLSTNFKNEFDGSGETTRDSKVTATLSARVIERTMDGNLSIRGFREIRVNNETQHIILSGIVRPSDIGPDNSILSSYIADAHIEYNGTGVIADRQRPGWLARGLDLVWPF